MKPITTLVAAIAIIGAYGPACALDRGSDRGLPPHATGRSAQIILIPGDPLPYTFADICNFTIGTQFPMASARAPSLMAAERIASDLPALGHPPPAPHGCGIGVASIMNASALPDGSTIGPTNMLEADADSVRAAPNANRKRPGSGDLFSLAAVPQRAGWQLLAGLAIMASIARRRSGWWPLGGFALGTALAGPVPDADRDAPFGGLVRSDHVRPDSPIAMRT